MEAESKCGPAPPRPLGLGLMIKAPSTMPGHQLTTFPGSTVAPSGERPAWLSGDPLCQLFTLTQAGPAERVTGTCPGW